MANIISYLIEAYNLLWKYYYGGWPSHDVEDIMMIIIETIYKAFKEKKVYRAIFIDVSKVFIDIYRKQLICNPRI